MDKLIEQFLEHLRADRKRGTETVANYRFYLKRFCSWGNVASPADITRDTVNRYRAWLGRDLNKYGKKLNTSTQNYHLIALRSFLKFLSSRGIASLPASRVPLTKMPARRIGVVEASDLEQLLDAPLHSNEPRIIQLRDKAMLELLFATGLRVSELANLTIDDADIAAGTVTVVTRRGRRTVALSQHTRQWLKQYLAARKDATKYIFVRHDRARKQQSELKHLTPRSIQRIIKQYGRDTGIERSITPRIVRSSVAARLLSKGTALTAVQTMLGHLSKATTQVYRRATSAAPRRTRGIFRWKKRKT